MKVDIKKFFASVPEEAVVRFFRNSCRCRSDVAKLLAKILTFDGKIATGSSASPIIAYYAFKPMFDEIAAFASEANLIFTCYVDDMTFSGTAATRTAMMEIRRIIARHRLKSHKVRKFGATDPKVVTGVCITSSGYKVPNNLSLKIASDFAALNGNQSQQQSKKLVTSLLGRLEAAGRIEKVYRARAVTLRSNVTDQ